MGAWVSCDVCRRRILVDRAIVALRSDLVRLICPDCWALEEELERRRARW